MYSNYFKRWFDFSLALFLLLLLSPLVLLLMLLVYLFLGAPVFFRQPRPGLNGKIFLLIKFRTMSNKKGLDGHLLPDAERLTVFGRFLRASSLDELPELWNVLLGDMSFVGPRPLLVEYLPLYNAEQGVRHQVRPGITGWAQINGRNQIPWQKRFEYDAWYVANRSFKLDLKILWLTIGCILKRKGINHAEHVTMEKFTGNKHAD